MGGDAAVGDLQPGGVGQFAVLGVQQTGVGDQQAGGVRSGHVVFLPVTPKKCNVKCMEHICATLDA